MDKIHFYILRKPNMADGHKLRALSNQQRTDGSTNKRTNWQTKTKTDRAAYRDAYTQQKLLLYLQRLNSKTWERKANCYESS